MSASTARLVFSTAGILLVSLCATAQAFAAAPALLVGGSTDLSRMEVVSSNFARLLSEELLRSGWYNPVESEAAAQYKVSVELLALGSAKRDSRLRIGREWSELERRLGEGRLVDQVKLDVEISDVASGASLGRRIIEGLESRKGTEIASENVAYLTYMNIRSDEFRRSSLGRAAYRALADSLDFIFETLPLKAEVEALADDAVVIGLDSSCGLAKGDDLVILRDIPFTSVDGTPVWHEYRRMGLVRIVDFQPGHCLCLILEGQGRLAEGDLAQPLLAPLWFPEEADQK
jgi:hypothetical protein